MGGLREQRPPERFGLRLRDLDVTPRVRAVPTPPLLADLGRMGKKKLDMTAHDGHLVISTDLAVAIDEGQLTGVELQPVRRSRSGRSRIQVASGHLGVGPDGPVQRL